jgi:hypothetical protein
MWPAVLRAALKGDDIFPWALPLGTPRGQDLSDHFDSSMKWLKEIRNFAHSHGLSFVETRIRHRSLGEQIIPTHLLWEDRDLYLGWAGRKGYFKLWLNEARATIEEFPLLNPWIYDNVAILEKHLKHWPAIRTCLRRFGQGNYQNLYLRELDVPSVDSKFIEQHRLLVSELLSLIIPSHAFDANLHPGSVVRFCQRFGLRHDQPLIRFRLLDDSLLDETGGFQDLSVPLSELKIWTPSANTIFIAENKVNGLSFPNCQGAMIIFGLGGGIDMLKELAWLHGKQIYYWGDIDSHGFAILARLRRYFPAVQSFLMDQETLLHARALCVSEDSPYTDAIDHNCLNPAEQALFASLQSNEWGENLRLEQERVPFGQLCERLRMLGMKLIGSNL